MTEGRLSAKQTNFPTDLYILQGVVENLDKGHKLLLAKSRDGLGVDYSEIESLIDS